MLNTCGFVQRIEADCKPGLDPRPTRHSGSTNPRSGTSLGFGRRSRRSTGGGTSSNTITVTARRQHSGAYRRRYLELSIELISDAIRTAPGEGLREIAMCYDTIHLYSFSELGGQGEGLTDLVVLFIVDHDGFDLELLLLSYGSGCWETPETAHVERHRMMCSPPPSTPEYARLPPAVRLKNTNSSCSTRCRSLINSQ